MEQNEIQNIINEIIGKTANAIRKVYATQQESVTDAITSNRATDQDSRIIFPKYSRNNKTNGGKIRISEQELRFIFVEQIKQIKNLHYSVETPTYYTYKSARDKQEPNIGGSMSGKIDLTLYTEPNPDKPIAFIEFKCGNLSKNDTEKKLNRELKYDFIKLVAESQYYHCFGYLFHLMKNPKRDISNNIKRQNDKKVYIDAAIDIIKKNPKVDQSSKFENADKIKDSLNSTIQYVPFYLNEL